MRHVRSILLVFCCWAATASAQTADELIAKNIEAKGGLARIKAIQTVRMNGRLQQGGMMAQVGQEWKHPDMLRAIFTLQGLTAVQAYDGKTAWQIQPFQGRKDPELMGEDDARGFIEDADLFGPIVDYRAKGNNVEYQGKDSVDGDDVHRLKVTLKNGDIYYYFIDPDSNLEIRVERQQFIRGSVRETVTEVGSYKPVAGVMFPFSIESGRKGRPTEMTKVTMDKIEANVPLDDKLFQMTAPAPAQKPATRPTE